MKSNILTFASVDQMQESLAIRVGEILRSTVNRKGVASIAISGGRTPLLFLKYFRGLSLPWPKIVVTLTDDRQVNPENLDSNERLVREELLNKLPYKPQFVSMRSMSSEELEKRFEALDWPLDVALLGMGVDGHTASWFTCDDDYKTIVDPLNEKRVMRVYPKKVAYDRVTLTLTGILDCSHVFLMSSGKEKRRVLDRVLGGTRPSDAFPLSSILCHKSKAVDIYWSQET